MRGVGMQLALSLSCAAALVGCGSSSNDDNKGAAGTGAVSAAGSTGDSSSSGGGSGGSGGAGGSGDSAGSGAAGIPAFSIACMGDAAANCPGPTGQTDGTPCCTKHEDIYNYYVSVSEDVCGLHFPDRVPCFELHGPGKVSDQCPQNLDAGDGAGGLSKWGRHEGCCHPIFAVCGILQPDTGCTLFRPSAIKPDGTMIGGMGSGDYHCTAE